MFVGSVKQPNKAKRQRHYGNLGRDKKRRRSNDEGSIDYYHNIVTKYPPLFGSFVYVGYISVITTTTTPTTPTAATIPNHSEPRQSFSISSPKFPSCHYSSRSSNGYVQPREEKELNVQSFEIHRYNGTTTITDSRNNTSNSNNNSSHHHDDEEENTILRKYRSDLERRRQQPTREVISTTQESASGRIDYQYAKRSSTQ